jgi:NAD(P)-dependent dehydrogenase (short-subunit alcohol dehydrogenase family)
MAGSVGRTTWALVFAAQAIVPQMRELGYGSIVNMSSVSWM